MLSRFLLLSVVVVFALVGSARGDITAADADFDGSGKVDITDFLQFVAAFGTQQGQSAYDAKYDLDDSGGVDITDFLLFVNVFGQTVQKTPPPPIEGSVEGDRAALVALYNATNGDNWGRRKNWLSNKPLGEMGGRRHECTRARGFAGNAARTVGGTYSARTRQPL